jgi:hypothetical protein
MALFIDFIIFTMTLFHFKNKKAHIVQYLFVFLLMVFLYTSFISIIVDNLELWKIKEKPLPYAIFRLAEIILFPTLSLWFVEFFHYKKNSIYKGLIYLLFLLLPVLLERWLIFIKIMEYKDWNIFKTVLVWLFFYAITLLIHRGTRKLLVKEGMLDDPSLS